MFQPCRIAAASLLLLAFRLSRSRKFTVTRFLGLAENRHKSCQATDG